MIPFMLCSLVVKIVSAILTPDGIYGSLDLCWRNEFWAVDRRKKVSGLEHIILVKWGKIHLNRLFSIFLAVKSDCSHSTACLHPDSLGSLAGGAGWFYPYQ